MAAAKHLATPWRRDKSIKCNWKFATRPKNQTAPNPVTKTVFSLRDGKPQGKWCPSPPGIGPILFDLITSPTSIPTFPVRKQGGSLQALVNVNAKAQFESNYWRGVLDAQGKVDGGYY